MYMLGAHLVATYSGKPYRSFVKERIFDPLNMSSTAFLQSDIRTNGGVMTHLWMYGRRISPMIRGEVIEMEEGKGSIISNAIDIVSSGLPFVKLKRDLMTPEVQMDQASPQRRC